MENAHTDGAPLKERILQYIEHNDYVTFAELNRRFGNAFTSGGHAIYLSEPRNIVVWVNMTEEASAAIMELLSEQQIWMRPASSILIYAVDGCMLRMPLARQARRYKEPHWFPVTLRPGAPPVDRKGKTRAAAEP